MPGRRANSVSSSVNSSQQQHRQHKKQCRHKPHHPPAGLQHQHQQQPCQHEPLDSDLSTHITSSCVSASTSVECLLEGVEQAAVVVSSRKRSRLVACSVVEVGVCLLWSARLPQSLSSHALHAVAGNAVLLLNTCPHAALSLQADPLTGSALRCKRTFEAADGCVVTVVRRMRKQLKPRASCSV